MSTLSSTSDATAPATPPAMPGTLVLLMASTTGLGAASLYYSQPILALLAADLGVGTAAVGTIPMLTQLGYAAGILLLTPLGDRYDRRRVILSKFGFLIAMLALCALAQGLSAFLLASALLGLAATLAQDVVPLAASLSPPQQRGRIVGQVMTGLLLGILLSRVISGLVAQTLGWRWVYGLAALVLVLLALASWRLLPSTPPQDATPYPALLRSLRGLWAREPALRRATLAQALLSLAFSAFWSTLAVMLHQRWGLSSLTAGAFGLAGAAGALAAPLAGRLSDRRGPARVAQLGAALTALGFAAMLPLPWLNQGSGLALLVAATVLFDFGVQSSLVAHQTLVYGLDATARSRLNALLVCGMFLGMASGAALGSLALQQWGWLGVVGLACGASLGALWLRRKV